jgi:Leucine-rich repeat (LRR) protein
MNAGNFFQFIKDKRGYEAPLQFKILNDLPISKEDLEVEEHLDLDNTEVTSLPAGLKVGTDLYLFSTPIKSLPSDLEVGGNLDLRNTPITQLPVGLKVGENLYLQNTKITSLPADLEVGGDLFIGSTPLGRKGHPYRKSGIKGRIYF